MPRRQRRYLSGLNGLRALASLVVLFWHVDRFSPIFGLEAVGYSENSAAHSAVVFFFVLSGFLITWLLLLEKANVGGISISAFYKRRALRILPPYLLVLIWSAAIIFASGESLSSYYVQYALYLGMLPNVANAFLMSIRTLLPLWSVGVEEQFYLLWPWVVRRVRWLPRALVYLLVLYLLLKLGFRVFEGNRGYQLVRLTSVSSLVIGAYAGWLFYLRSRWLKRLYSLPLQVFCWLFLLYGVIVEPIQITSMLAAETQAPVYACLILNVAGNPRSLIRCEGPILNYLGKISYGIYLFHLPLLFSVAAVLRPLLSDLPNTIGVFLANLIVLGLTIGVASLSYRYLEGPLLRLKPSPLQGSTL